MKGIDNKIFLGLLLISFIIGILLYDNTFDRYSDMITFLSIMVGFKITSIAILYNSALKKTLYNLKNKEYGTELHRLKYFFKHALVFEMLSILIILILPDCYYELSIRNYPIKLGKYMLALPILIGVFYCFYKILNDLLKIFVHPTNE